MSGIELRNCGLALAMAASILLGAVSRAASADKPADSRHSKGAFITWARAAAVKLRTVEPNEGNSDLAPLCDMLGPASVVALGEAGHGAHEPLALRNRLFFYLVEHCGFTAIALESSFTESRAIYDFVAGGPGDAADIARQGLTWGFGKYQENAQLLQWMRDYNRGVQPRQRPAGQRVVHFYGIDLSGADHEGGFSGAQAAMDSALNYAKTVAPKESQKLFGELAPLLGRMSTAGFAELAKRHDPCLDAALKTLDRYLKTHAVVLQRSTSTSEYDWAVRNVSVARQLRDLLGLGIDSKASDTILPDDYRMDEVRDAAMASNALWVRSEEGKGGRVLVFTHNGHAMNAPTRGGVWSVYSKPPRTMGQSLRAALGGSLLIVGTVAAHTGGALAQGEVPGNSIDEALSEIGLPLFALDLRGATRNPGAIEWLDQRRPLRANFDSELDINVRDAFDWLVYIDRVYPARRSGG